ncbi:uncharacterized protein LOC132394413 isoform X1 [Hypanus sabinus]|uniref:uncharacterized protein LOC132394413 isoform X1 n=1 Tax=Hypanus sabinus TaxID=79690 RepID=UPI0028C4F325|nr:uncharacterized protein LOC132394413 isoform X1 [Hypanus sabinus]
MASLLGTQLHHTTAYHPQSNGLVERFHRHLKSALISRLRGANWADELPWVLLGIRTAPKDDLHASSAELVYGAPLVVPGEFLPAPRGQEEDPAAILGRLREKLGNLAPIPTSQHGRNLTCVPKDLQNCYTEVPGRVVLLVRCYSTWLYDLLLLLFGTPTMFKHAMTSHPVSPRLGGKYRFGETGRRGLACAGSAREKFSF